MDKNKKKSQNQISDDALGNVSGGAVEIKLTGSDAEQYLKQQSQQQGSSYPGNSFSGYSGW